jgi:glycine/D-amino acid oxidase-like deaminating enzyme
LNNSSFKSASYIIVGQGLAGSILAYLLLEAGATVKIIDNSSLDSSSKVAAGIYNPVTGRKLVKTWMADALFPFLEDFYLKLSHTLKADFFHPVAIYRPFPNEEVQQYFKSDKINPDFYDFASLTFDNTSTYANIVRSNLGGVTTQHSGWVDLKIMLGAFRNYFLEKGIISEGTFTPSTPQDSSATVIFCEGFHALNNPFFKYLPFSPVKGEVLEASIDDISLDTIINQGAFVVPLGNNLFRIGATYSWHQLDFEPTAAGKEDLLGKYQKLMKPALSIKAHAAGVRPATKDRRPFIGMHPAYPQIGIFNGLGSKGVSLAPYFAQQFVDFLLKGKELSPEVNINRFASLYLSVDK